MVKKGCSERKCSPYEPEKYSSHSSPVAASYYMRRLSSTLMGAKTGSWGNLSAIQLTSNILQYMTDIQPICDIKISWAGGMIREKLSMKSP